MGPEEISSRLRSGQFVVDSDFDAWLPDSVRRASARYWTQVGVAIRVSRWLQACGAASVLDVGSGAGKFCVVGALASRMSFTGLEQRDHLVDAADALAERFGVSGRARFVHGELAAVDFTQFDALYFYNPFGENAFPPSDWLDDTVEVSRARLARDVVTVERLLARMPVGSHLTTYNGCGARVPDSFELVHAKMAGLNLLRLWRKARENDDGGYWLEFEDSTLLRRPNSFALTPAKCGHTIGAESANPVECHSSGTER
jgi:SAM-dependent methyltransferase